MALKVVSVAATGTAGRIDATGLQIPDVLDDLYTYDGDLGVTWEGGVPTVALWLLPPLNAIVVAVPELTVTLPEFAAVSVGLEVNRST